MDRYDRRSSQNEAGVSQYAPERLEGEKVRTGASKKRSGASKYDMVKVCIVGMATASCLELRTPRP